MTQTENTELAAIDQGEEHDGDDGQGAQHGSFVAMRRKVLGALAIGVVASACSSADEGIGPANPQAPVGDTPSTTLRASTSSTAKAVAEANATGPELELVSLPVPAELKTGSAGAGAGGTTGGGSVAAAEGSSGTSAATANGSGGTSSAVVVEGTGGTPAAAATTGGATASTASTAAPANGDVMTGSGASAATPTKAVQQAADDDTVIVGMGDQTGTATAAPAAKAADATAATPTTDGPDQSDQPANPAQPITPSSVSVGDLLLANRITFGVTPAVLAEIKRLGSGGFIEDQLRRTSPDPEAEKRVAGHSLLRMTSKQVYEAVRPKKFGLIQQQLIHSNLLRATYSKSQLYENMCHLWMDHFNAGVIAEGGKRHYMVNYQEKVIRPHALGSFRDLLKATAHAPAMLAYLDNATSNANSKQGINENYGRELLELHTLGIDAAGNHVYTEADVRSASMAMSGWSFVGQRKNAKFGEFEFKDAFHHKGNISLLNGAWTRGGTTGKATGESLLNFLAVHPSTARHVAYKICRRFVSDAPSAALVASTAAVYLQNDTQLVPTLRHVLTSAEFAASGGQKIRRPFEHMVATLRALNVNVANDPASKGAARLRNTLHNMDNAPWFWPQPDGYPDSAADWLTTDGLSSRWTLGVLTARDTIPNVKMNYSLFKPKTGTVGDLISGLSVRFGLGGATSETSAAVAKGAKLDLGAAANALTNEELADVLGLVIAHPIFQTR